MLHRESDSLSRMWCRRERENEGLSWMFERERENEIFKKLRKNIFNQPDREGTDEIVSD